jgi:hypothetical protein
LPLLPRAIAHDPVPPEGGCGTDLIDDTEGFVPGDIGQIGPPRFGENTCVLRDVGLAQAARFDAPSQASPGCRVTGW